MFVCVIFLWYFKLWAHFKQTLKHSRARYLNLIIWEVKTSSHRKLGVGYRPYLWNYRFENFFRQSEHSIYLVFHCWFLFMGVLSLWVITINSVQCKFINGKWQLFFERKIKKERKTHYGDVHVALFIYIFFCFRLILRAISRTEEAMVYAETLRQ